MIPVFMPKADRSAHDPDEMARQALMSSALCSSSFFHDDLIEYDSMRRRMIWIILDCFSGFP